jgi:flavin-dependent dehydrogenase
VDPLTGGGMTQAMLCAELLAAHTPRLLDGDLAAFRAFDRERNALLRDYRVLTQLVLALARRPAVARATVRLLGATPRLFAHLIGVAGGARRLVPGGQY